MSGNTTAGAVRRVGSYAGFSLAVAGPDAIAGCRAGAELTFRVDDRPARETPPLSGRSGTLDLTGR
jgi:hypothetical protein